MRISLRLRLPLTYLLVIAMAVGGSGLIIHQFLREHFLNERRTALLIQGSIIANSAREALLDDTLDLGRLTRTFAEQLKARVMILDTTGKVLTDAFGKLDGKAFEHPVWTGSLGGKTAVYEHHYGTGQVVLHVLVPIFRVEMLPGDQSGLVGRELAGAVFISSSLDDIYASLAVLQGQLVAGSAAVAAIAALMGLVLARSITSPLLALTQVARRMSHGERTTKVKERGDQELYELGAAFNHMSGRLQALEEARMRFISDASHEMRAPLAAMKALVEPLVAELRVSPETRQEFLVDLAQEIDRLSTLAADLLQLARLDSRLALVREPYDLAGLTRRVGVSLMALAQTRGVRITTSVPEQLLYFGDESSLHRAVLNIVDNAIKFASHRVNVVLTSTPDAVDLAISDDGPGIPREAQERIFERFYRVDQSRARTTGGSGLGLAIAWEVVTAHGGSIRVDSIIGEGATFTITLPLGGLAAPAG